MFSSYFTLILTLFSLSLATASFKHDNERCGCLSSCESKYHEITRTALEEKTACQRGCRLFRLIVREGVPHRNIQKRSKDVDYCVSSCLESLFLKHQLDACLVGCENGCDYLSFQPRVKLTILVDEPNSASVDLEPILLDPGLKQLQENKHDLSKSKIPASFFTNLPIAQGHDHGCHTDFHLCETWLVSEPLVCMGLLIIAVGLLLAAYWRRNKPKEVPTDQAPMLPEKISLQLSV